MADESNVGKDENILYDLLINAEWPPEMDTQLPVNKERRTSVIAEAVTGAFRSFRPSSSHLPPGLVRLANKQIKWQLELAGNGKLLAVVRDLCVEIRSARDDFGSTVGTCRVPEDPGPQWRRVAWSHDCTLLAYADSTGTVRIFDLTGDELFFITPTVVSFPGDISCAAAGLVFLEYTASSRWSAELLVITYGGGLTSYLVSVGTNQSFQENHSFRFSAGSSQGITSVTYHPGHRLLLVGGCESGDDGGSMASRCGITAWRVLPGSPYYKKITCYEDDVSATRKRALPCFRVFSRQGVEQDGVFRFSLSPDGSGLAVIHFSGRLSLWDVPSLRQRSTWSQEQQPGFEAMNPEWEASLKKRKKLKEKDQYYPLSDVSWWSDNALILARCSGSLSVFSVGSLRNLLGKSCEWLEPAPRLTATHGGRFLGLECELRPAQKRSCRPDGSPSGEGEESESDSDSDSDDDSSPEDRYRAYIKHGLYYVTEMDRFAPPPRKRLRTLVKNYRLVSLRSTTPMELYQRKIDHEEYGEALAVAQAYDLDTDLVYQRRWRKSSADIASMQDYLSKIRKRSTVLDECVERVPENVDAAKELLEYGLKGTNLEALIAISNGEDGGRFTLAEDTDLNDLPLYQDFLSAEEALEREMERKERQNRKRQTLLAQVDFSRMTLEQKELCQTRLKLLSYLDRLATYEELLGGPHAAEERFDAEFFQKFRSQNIVLSARNYARESNVQALDVLFTYHGAKVLRHRLPILCNLPETTSPHQYAALLPEAFLDDSGEKLFAPWIEQRHREMDWCEAEECRAVLDQAPRDDDDHSFLYEEAPELLRFRTLTPSIQLLADWYLSRARAIESCSRQVDCALALVSLGKERKIPGLELLYDDLVTMETLVYDTLCEPGVALQDLQQLSDINKLRLLMNNSNQERYVKDVLQRMMPFLHRCESRVDGMSSALLREYLVDLARRDLSLPLTIFQHSKPDCQQKIIGHSDQLLALALQCIYSSERDDQLSLCYDILECLPERDYGPETDVTSSLHDQVDQLEKHLSVVGVLEKHGLQKPVVYVQNSQNSEEEAHRLMFTLCRHAGRKAPPVCEAEWRGLLLDLLDMQQDVYTCLKAETCHQVYVESLLCSGRAQNIRLAGNFMHCSKVSQDAPVSRSSLGKGQTLKVAYDRSVELVLAAAREYFNSSTSLTDPCMELARASLLLITDLPPAIREELDLINALCRLEDFGVNMLPLQVRLRSNRLSVVEECISQCSTAYKQSAALLHLAELLRVAGDDEATRKGQVLTLLAEHALKRLDFKTSYVHCHNLMAAGYSLGWEVSSLLGQSEGYTDLRAREELLAFSLAHCPPDDILRLLAASSDLHSEALYQAVNNQMDPTDAQRRRDGDETVFPRIGAPSLTFSVAAAGDLLHKNTVATTIEVLATTGLTTKAAMSGITDNCWLKDSVNYRPIHGQGAGSGNQEGAGENANLERQGCSPFYQELLDDPYIDPSQDVYFGSVPQENVTEVLLRTGKLAETKTEGRSPFSATEVLLQLASDAFARDLTLALAYLLALPQVLDANRCFERQSQSAVSLQLAAYYYSLLIYSYLVPCFKDKTRSLYQSDPTLLIPLVTRHVSAHSDWPEELEKLIGQLRAYNERLTELTQTQVLQGLCRGVDIRRFNSDTEYKKESILGLAETLNDSGYRTSLCLAQRYNIPLWEVYMTQLEFLFTDSGLSTKDIEKRSRALGLFEVLKAEPQAFHDRMTKYVLPGVEGTDLGRLLYYYTLLEAAGCEDYRSAGRIKLESHVKLLRKLRAVANGLDYHELTDGSSHPLSALGPVLSSQNVLSLSKLAHHLPVPGGDGRGGAAFLSASAVHGAWLQSLFWRGDPQLLKRPPQSDRDFLHAFDVCSRYLERLSPGDALRFLDDVTLSPAAADRLSVPARREVVRRAAAALRRLGEKRERRRRGEAEEEEEDGGEREGTDPAAAFTFERAAAHLRRSQAHLDALGHAFIMSLRGSPRARLRGYSRAYDLARSERSGVRKLAVAMATDGQPLEMIGELLAVTPRLDPLDPPDPPDPLDPLDPPDLSVRSVLHDAVQRVLSSLGGHADALANYPEPLWALEAMVRAVHAAAQNGAGPVTSDDLLAWLRPFCSDPAQPERRRCDVLRILEDFGFGLRPEDWDMMGLLLLRRTRDIVLLLRGDGSEDHERRTPSTPSSPERRTASSVSTSSVWTVPDVIPTSRTVEMEDVETEAGRRALFQELLEAARTREEFRSLALLLRAWPPMTTTEEESDNPWVALTAALLAHCPRWGEEEEQEGEAAADGGGRVLAMVRSLRGTGHRLPAHCVGRAAALLLDRGFQPDALKLMAESRDGWLLQLALDQVNGMALDAAATAAASRDHQLLRLLLDAGLLAGCVSSALYAPLVSLLLAGRPRQEGEEEEHEEEERRRRWDVEEVAAQLLAAGHGPEAGSLLLAHRGRSHQSHGTFGSALNAIRKWL